MVVANITLIQKSWDSVRATGSHSEEAHQEYHDSVLSQADFPLGSATAGDYFVRINRPIEAIRFCERALQEGENLSYLRLNLVTLYGDKGQNDKAATVLHTTLQYEPKNAGTYYSSALLYNEEGRYVEAKNILEKAVQFGTKNENIQRNYRNSLRLLAGIEK